MGNGMAQVVSTRTLCNATLPGFTASERVWGDGYGWFGNRTDHTESPTGREGWVYSFLIELNFD